MLFRCLYSVDLVVPVNDTLWRMLNHWKCLPTASNYFQSRFMCWKLSLFVRMSDNPPDATS